MNTQASHSHGQYLTSAPSMTLPSFQDVGSDHSTSNTVSLHSKVSTILNATSAAEQESEHKSDSNAIANISTTITAAATSLSISSTSSSTLSKASFSSPSSLTTVSSYSSPSSSSATTSSMLQQPTVNITRSSSMSISSLLSEDCTPILSRRISFSESCTDSDQDGEDSDISDDMETAKPTREDVALMAEGTQASAMLKRIQDNPIDLEDIISLLVAKMAILILPTCTAVTQEKEPSRARFEDHVIMPRGNGSEWLFETLSGVRLMPTSSSTITISDSIADNGEGPSAMAATKPTNKSTDNYTSNHGKSGVTNEHSVKELKLVNTSTSPIAISIESVGIIHVLLVDAIIPAPTVRQQYTLDKRSMGSNSGSRSTDVRGTPLKRRRRRRVTTEEDSRVVPDGSESDPNARARYKCNQCEKTFSRPYNLRSHRATHVGLKPFKCTHVNEKGDKCSWAFARKHDLVRHMSSRHAFEKPFKCTTCGAECGRNDSMKRHYEKSQICAAAALKKSQSQSQPQSLSPSPSQYQHRSQSPSPSPSQSQSQLQSQSQSQSQSQPQYQSQSQRKSSSSPPCSPRP